MHLYAIRLRGLKLLQITEIPENAIIEDIQSIVTVELGGIYDIHFFSNGKLLHPSTSVLTALVSSQPSADGYGYFLYFAKPRSMLVQNPRYNRNIISSSPEPNINYSLVRNKMSGYKVFC